MRDKGRIAMLLSIVVVGVITILVGVFFISKSIINSDKKPIVPTITQQSSTEAKDSETSESTSETTDELDLEEFLEVYFTWELTEESVNSRAIKLQDMMSLTCYEKLKIESDSDLLQELIRNYETKKEINTSNSMQLVSSEYISSQIYQNTENETLYYVQVTTEENAPYQEGYTTERDYQIYFTNKQVTQVKLINTN